MYGGVYFQGSVYEVQDDSRASGGHAGAPGRRNRLSLLHFERLHRDRQGRRRHGHPR